jgi:hypothetical protein
MTRYCPYDNQECQEKGCEGCSRRISRKDFLKLPMEKRREILSRMVDQQLAQSPSASNSCEAAGMD